MPRIKTVFSKPEPVAELWAKQSQESAEYVYWSVPGASMFCPATKGIPKERVSALYFRGTDIFSYGSHYLLGRLMEFRGKKIACVNKTSYSITTRQHTRVAERAARDAGFLVLEIDAVNSQTFRHFHAGATDKELTAAILEELKRKLSQLYTRLELLSGKEYTRRNVSCTRDEIDCFNYTLNSVNLNDLHIHVPESYWEYCTLLSLGVQVARKDHDSRRQLVFDLSGAKGRTTLLPYVPMRERLKTS